MAAMLQYAVDNVNGLGPVESLRATLRRVAFEALYSRFAWAYDWVSRTFFLGQWRVWQRASLHFVRGRRVLEIGMGTGNLQFDLLHAGYDAFGIDFSPQMLKQARRKAARPGAPWLLYCRARAQQIPFPTGAFDTVISTFPSEYIADPRTLSEIARVLSPGGRLVIVPGGWLRSEGTRARLFGGVSELVYGDRAGGTGLDIDRVASERLQRTGWVRLLGGRLRDAGFSMLTFVGSNVRGAVLVIVAEKRH